MRRDTILPPEPGPDDEPSEARRPIDDEVRRHLVRASGILRDLVEPPALDDEELDEPGCRPLVLELLVTAVAAALLAVCMVVLFVLVCFT